MIFEDNYMEYLEDTYHELSLRAPKNGKEVQDICLDNVDPTITERERLLFMLPVIKYEVEYDMLTEEVKDELYLYYKDMISGKFDGLLGDDEEEVIKNDLFECYNKVFENDV